MKQPPERPKKRSVLRHAASTLDETAPILISFYDTRGLPVVAQFAIK
jgi:hypothetical protein